jgi:hypothetical protein
MPERFTQAHCSLVNLRKEERAGHAQRVFRFINRLVSPLPNWPLRKNAGLLGKMGLSPDRTRTEKTHLASEANFTSRRRVLSSIFLFLLRVFSSLADCFLRNLFFRRLLQTSPAGKNLQISFRKSLARLPYGGQSRRRCGSSYIVLCWFDSSTAAVLLGCLTGRKVQVCENLFRDRVFLVVIRRLLRY